MRNNLRNHLKALLPILGLLAASCATTPPGGAAAYCLPGDGETQAYVKGDESRAVLGPLAESLGIEDFDQIEPLLDRTDRIYLVMRGNELFVQGEGDYSRGMINLSLGTNREWEKRKIGRYKVYESEETGLQIVFPDSRFFFLSRGSIGELLSLYSRGGSPYYPFDDRQKEQEALLVNWLLEGGNRLPLQDVIKTPFAAVELAITPAEEGFLLDVTLRGEAGKGRVLGSALKFFLLASVGRDVMKAESEIGDDFARIVDIGVDPDFLVGLLGQESL